VRAARRATKHGRVQLRQQRGVEEILIACGGGLKPLPEAIEAAFLAKAAPPCG
jgi:hypothetical protein